MDATTNNKKILLLNGETVQAVCLAEELTRFGYSITLLCSQRLSYGYFSRFASKKILLPCSPHSHEDSYIFLKSLLEKERYDIVLPMNDDGAIVLSKYKETLKELTHIHIPDWNIFCRGYNKGALLDACEEYDIPHPRTRVIDSDNYEDLRDFVYPALIKPDCTCGARGMTLVTSFEELKEKYPPVFQKYGHCHLQEFIPSGGRQIEIQILLSKTKEIAFSSVISKQRIYPVKGGSSCCCNTIHAPELVQQCFRLLKAINWEGFADFDMIEDPRDKAVKIVEINPRVPACIKAAHAAHIQYGPLLAADACNESLPPMEYKPGARLRYIGFEILWLIKSENRFRTNPNWFNFFEKGLCFQDFNWKDPFSFWGGSIGHALDLLSSDYRKEKKGI